jgi:hypothetical protein
MFFQAQQVFVQADILGVAHVFKPGLTAYKILWAFNFTRDFFYLFTQKIGGGTQGRG